MIIRKARFAAGIITLSLIGVLVSSAVFAQRGPSGMSLVLTTRDNGRVAQLLP